MLQHPYEGIANKLDNFIQATCCNLSLGFAIKVRACKGVGQKGSLGVTSHILGSVGECEGMNLHTPKWTLILGVGLPVDSWTFRHQLQGLNP
jgi:hypothetical protein